MSPRSPGLYDHRVGVNRFGVNHTKGHIYVSPGRSPPLPPSSPTLRPPAAPRPRHPYHPPCTAPPPRAFRPPLHPHGPEKATGAKAGGHRCLQVPTGGLCVACAIRPPLCYPLLCFARPSRAPVGTCGHPRAPTGTHGHTRAPTGTHTHAQAPTGTLAHLQAHHTPTQARARPWGGSTGARGTV